MKLLNQKAPTVTLQDQDGITRSLTDYKGQVVLLYFYPKDLTPGCTIEAQGFRDKLDDLKAVGIQVLGVSVDDVKSHKKFAQKHNFNFPLLADIDRKAVNDYGVWVEKSMFGKKYMGAQRDSFLINKEGVILKHYVKVNPIKHPQEVIDDVKNLGL